MVKTLMTVKVAPVEITIYMYANPVMFGCNLVLDLSEQLLQQLKGVYFCWRQRVCPCTEAAECKVSVRMGRVVPSWG
jgi:hypothetical protein